MNPETPLPPRDEIEAQLTAFILGELPADQAFALGQAIEKDAELAKLYQRLQKTVELVRETTADSRATTPSITLKMSDERRERLLAQFKTTTPKEFQKARPTLKSWLLPIAAAAAIMLLAAISIPNFVKSRTTSQSNAIINNLRQLDGAKQQWALENHKSDNDTLTFDDLKPYFKGSIPPAVHGEKYELGRVGDPVTANVEKPNRKSTLLLLSSEGTVTEMEKRPATTDPRYRLSANNAPQSAGAPPLVDAIQLRVARPTPKVLTASGGGRSNGDTMRSIEELKAGSGNQNRGDKNGLVTDLSFSDGEKPKAAHPNANIALPSFGEESTLTAGAGQNQGLLAGKPMIGDPEWVGILEKPAYPANNESPFVGRYAYIEPAAAASISQSLRGAATEGLSDGTLQNRDTSGLKPQGLDVAGAKPSAEPAKSGVAGPVGQQRAISEGANATQLSFGGIADSEVLLRRETPPAQSANGSEFGRSALAQTEPSSQSAALGIGGGIGGLSGEKPAENKWGFDLKDKIAPPAAITLGDQFGVNADRASKSGDVSGAPSNVYSLQIVGYDDFAKMPQKDSPADKVKGLPAKVELPQLAEVVAAPPSAAFSVPVEAAVSAAASPTAPAQQPTPARGYRTPAGTIPNQGIGTPGAWAGGGLSAAAPAVQPQGSDPAFRSRTGIATEGKEVNGRAETTFAFDDALALRKRFEAAGATNSSYDRNTYYRLLSQSGTDEFAQDNKQGAESLKRQAGLAGGAVGGGGVPMNTPAPMKGDNAAAAVPSASPLSSGQGGQSHAEDAFRRRYGLAPSASVGMGGGRAGGTTAASSEAAKAYTKTELESIETRQQLVKVEAKKDSDGRKSSVDWSETARSSNEVLDAELAKRKSGISGGAGGGGAGGLPLAAEQQTTSSRRELIRDKMQSLSVSGLKTEGLNLGEVVRNLQEESKKKDPAKRGVNIILNPSYDAKPPVGIGSLDATTGLPVNAAYSAESDIAALTIGTNLADKNLPLTQALDAIVASSGRPIKYSIENYGVVISAADPTTKSASPKTLEAYKAKKSELEGLIETRQQLAKQVAAKNKDSDRRKLSTGGIDTLRSNYEEQDAKVAKAQKELDELAQKLQPASTTATNEVAAAKLDLDIPKRVASTNAPIPQPEIQTADNAFSTFSLNVSDVSFKLAAASLEKGELPDSAGIRSEEFINAFDYRDPEPRAGVPIGFAWERAQYPFAQNRDLLRFSVKTAAQGRQAGRPLNIVLLLDNSGSMERADRVQITRAALRVLAAQLQPQDTFSIVTFARIPRLLVDGVPGNQAAQAADQVAGLTPEGGTNLEEALNRAYETALRHYLPYGVNRVVVLTDGAANLGNVDPEALKQKVEAQRKQGFALDCFGIGWEGYNDDLLETLSRNGDGRYGFINTPEEASTEFAGQLAGVLQVAASDVKVQVEFNPARVTAYRQVGYAKHQLTKEQFRDNTVDAAEIGAAEAGNALYVIETNPAGEGPLATVRVRFKVPGTSEYREHAWPVPYNGNATAMEQASPAMRLAADAGAFSEWLAVSPYAQEVTPDALLRYLGNVPEVYGADARPKKLEWMIRQAQSLTGK